MRKFYLFALLMAATTLFAEDGVLLEKFSTINQTKSVASDSWKGDICNWATVYTRHKQPNYDDSGYGDFINVDEETKMPCCWMSTDGASQVGSIRTTNLEGGIKAVSFLWAQFGGESGNTLQLKIAAGEMENNSETKAGADGENRTKGGKLYSYAFENKTNCQLSITNISTKGGNNACRILVGEITITPYLYYTEKKAMITLGAGSYINKALINNTEGGEILYSISENAIGAAINSATGEVTAEQPGEVTVTASWEGVTTSYSLRIVPENFKIETFDNAEETAHTYATSEESTQGDVCKWYAYLGGIKSMTDPNYQALFPTNYACFRAPHDGATDIPYIKSDVIQGGIKYLKFACNPTASEASTTWDIRVFINDVQVGEASYGGLGAAPQENFKQIEIQDINVDGDFVIRFENHSTVEGGYTEGNKGRIAIDNIEWEGYVKPCEGEYGILVDGETYIAGTLNTEQTAYTEYIISAQLQAGQTIQLYDNCTKFAFLPNGQEKGGYWFSVNDDVWSAPASGLYTICLKMYGYENNWIWTAFDAGSGIGNAAVKADVRKVVENGTVVIYRNGVRYNLQGKEL